MITTEYINDLSTVLQNSRFFYTLIIDHSGTVKYVNEAFQSLNGNGNGTEDDTPSLKSFFSEQSVMLMQDVLKNCLQETGVPVRTDLFLFSNDNAEQLTRWEFTCRGEGIYGIGYKVKGGDGSEQRKTELEIKNQKLLTQAAIDAQEKERLEMGKELHDNINQHLNTTRLYLEVARDKASGEVKEMINFSHIALAGIIDKIRMLSQSLVPHTLGEIGLIESIQDICDSLQRTHKFKVVFFHGHFNEKVLPENLPLMLFRITQEQVNNILKHAEASQIIIKLLADAESLQLSIIDNGKGFDLTNYKKGLGFANITNRAGLFNGSVDIDTAQGKGCALTVSIPLASIS